MSKNIKLTAPGTFANGTQTRVLPIGTDVEYVRTETTTEVVHTATYVEDGVKWVQEIRKQKTLPRLVTENTASATGAAVALTVARQVGGEKAVRLAEVEKTLNDDVFMLIYDIPEALNEQCPNPSRIFWRHGFRLNKSCWVMPKKGLESPAVQEVLAHWESVPGVKVEHDVNGFKYVKTRGVEVHSIRYAADQLSKIREIARDKLAEELIRIHTALITRIADASDALEKANANLDEMVAKGEEVTEKMRAKPQNTHLAACRSAIRDAATYLDGAIKSAEIFDDNGSLCDLLEGVRQAILAEQQAFNALAASKGRKQVTDLALAA